MRCDASVVRMFLHFVDLDRYGALLVSNSFVLVSIRDCIPFYFNFVRGIR